jgi:hypothetical protein
VTGDMANDDHQNGDQANELPDDNAPDGTPGGEWRTETWPCDGVAELELAIEVGRLELTLAEQGSAVQVRVRPDPGATAPWNQGLPGWLSWLGEGTGTGSIKVGGRSFPFGSDLDLGELLGRDLDAEAVRATRIHWSGSARRLQVRSPDGLPLRLVPLVVTVHAPAGSRLTLATSAAEITVTGRGGDTTARSGSGDVRLDVVDGFADLVTGSGNLVAGTVSGPVRAKTGSGDLTLAGLGGPTEVRAGSGTVRLGSVRADLTARTGSGGITVDDAAAGQLRLSTGSGDLRVGVHPGVSAELDITSGSGRVHSELEVRGQAPERPAGLVVHGRTGSGDVLVRRAAQAA